MKAIVWFLCKLVLLSLLAIPTVDWFDRIYRDVLQYGVADTGDIPFMSSHMLYLLFVLVLATPKLGPGRRVAGIAAGICLYLFLDRLMVPIWKVLPYTQKAGTVPAKEFYTNVYYMFMHWMLPFVLWILIAHKQIEEMCRGKLPIEAATAPVKIAN